MNKDVYFMNEALKEAELALKEEEVPVGCVLVCDNQIIARSHNTTKKDGFITSHAEINCINIASKKLHTTHLDKCELYVTLEPCFMCAGAIYNSKIKRVIYGLKDAKNGGLGGNGDLFMLPGLNHYTLITSDVEKDKCHQLLKDFFVNKR